MLIHPAILTGHHWTQQKHPYQYEHRGRHEPRQQVFEEARRGLSGEGNIAARQGICDLGIDANGERKAKIALGNDDPTSAPFDADDALQERLKL